MAIPKGEGSSKDGGEEVPTVVEARITMRASRVFHARAFKRRKVKMKMKRMTGELNSSFFLLTALGSVGKK